MVLLLAAVLGTGGGVAAGLAERGDDGDHLSRSTPSAGDDPLHLGVEHADLDCTGQAALVVAYGDTPTVLRGAVADHGEAVRYLRTADSCDVPWSRDETRPTPEWVAYLGPYDGLVEPCRSRMTLDHKGDNVVVLSPATDVVRCVCVLPTADMPELRVGMTVDPELGIWVRALQGMLVDIDPGRFPAERVTGQYDAATAARMEPLQAFYDIAPGGPVDESSWRALRERACPGYDF